jgi:hypothetical protein
MPYRQTRFSRAENAEFVLCLQQLQAEGIDVEIPSAWIDPPPDPDRLTLDQIHDGTAKIYDLPSHAILIVIPARLSVLKSGILFTDVSLKIPWEDCPLELNEPGQELTFDKLTRGTLPDLLPTILNRWLKSEVPLRPRCVEGVILAEGWTSFPTDYRDGMPVAVNLLLEDERHNKINFEFEVRIDRSLKRTYERKQKQYFRSIQVPKGGLFEPLQPTIAELHHERRQAAAGRPGGIGNDVESGAPQVGPSNRSEPSLEQANNLAPGRRHRDAERAV